jgi:hypothetical protein
MRHRNSPPALVVVIACALALAGSGCIKLPWQRYSHWKAVRSKHVTIYTDTKFLYGHTVETFEYAYAAVSALPIFRNQQIAPVEVLFLEEPDFVSVFSRQRSGATIAELPGQGRLGARSLIVVFEDTSMAAAAHRLTHLFLHAKLPKAPLWLHEAYASYLETARYANDAKGTVSCFGYLGGSDKLAPLPELFGLRWEDYDSSGKSDWYRQSSRVLLDYLYMGENGKFRSTIPILLGRFAVGGTTAQALNAALPGVAIDDLDRRMRDFHKESEMHPRPLCPLSVPVPPESLADTAKPQEEPVSEEDIRQLLLRTRLLPHRTGHIDWYPPEAVTLATEPTKPPAAVAPVEGENGSAP